MDIGGWGSALTALLAVAAGAGVFVVSLRNSSTRATVNQYRDTAASQATRLIEYEAAQRDADVKIAHLEAQNLAKTTQLAALEKVVTSRDLITELTAIIVKHHDYLDRQMAVLSAQVDQIIANQAKGLTLLGEGKA